MLQSLLQVGLQVVAVGVASRDEWPILLFRGGSTRISFWSDGALPVVGRFCFFLESVGVTYTVI